MPESLAPKARCCCGVCDGGMLQRSQNVHKQQPLSNSYRYINKGSGAGKGFEGV